LLRQDLVKNLIARKDGDLCTIKEALSEASSIMSRQSVRNGELAENNGVLLLANKLKRQLQYRSEAIGVEDQHALKAAVTVKILQRRHSADDLISNKLVFSFF